MRKMTVLGNSFAYYQVQADVWLERWLVRSEDGISRVLMGRRFFKEVEMDGVGREMEEKKKTRDEFMLAFFFTSLFRHELG